MLGPGDDGALIQSLPGGLVISTDSYFEGSHYQSAWLDPSSSASAASAQRSAIWLRWARCLDFIRSR